MDMEIYKGQRDLADYILQGNNPTLIEFLIDHSNFFVQWHDDPMNPEAFFQVWSKRFVDMFAKTKGITVEAPKTPLVLEICKHITELIKSGPQTIASQQQDVAPLVENEESVARGTKRLHEAIDNAPIPSRDVQPILLGTSQEINLTESANDFNLEELEDDDNSLEPTWSVNGVNLSETFSQFRSQCCRKFLVNDELTVTEKMAVNRVYLLNHPDDVVKYCFESYSIMKDLITLFEVSTGFRNATQAEVQFVNEVANYKVLQSDDQAKNLVDRNLFHPDLSMYARVLQDLVTNYDADLNLQTADEISFINCALSPFVNAVFPVGPHFRKSGYSTALEGYPMTKTDIKIYTTIGSENFDLLVFEVKCPQSTSEDDLFMLSVKLQLTLNRLIKNGVTEPVVYGVMVYDYTCSFYRMSLTSSRIYTMMKIRTCTLPQSHENLQEVGHILPCFLQLRELVNRMRQSLVHRLIG